MRASATAVDTLEADIRPMRLPNISFKQLLFYGEVVGFLFAWAVGLTVAWNGHPQDSRLAGVENFAATTDLRGGAR